MTNYLNLGDKSDVKEVISCLQPFLQDASALIKLGSGEKIQLVKQLKDDLENDVLQESWNDNARTLALETIKICTRDAEICAAFMESKGMELLLKLSGLEPPITELDDCVSQEALKCIANTLLLKPDTRKVFENNALVTACIARLKLPNLSIESKFLMARILFVLTADRLLVVEELLKDGTFTEHFTKLLRENVDAAMAPSHQAITPVMVISELLKLLFNLMMNAPRCNNIAVDTKQYESAVESIRDVLLKIPPAEPIPMAPPHSHAVHALLNFPVLPPSLFTSPSDAPKSLREKDAAGSYAIVDFLIQALKATVEHTLVDDDDDGCRGVADADELISPLALLMAKIATEDKAARSKMREKLLPDDTDRTKPLGKGKSFTHRLIQLLTCITLNNSREAMGELLFTLCDEDANVFAHRVGYGNAAGFLMSRNILIPQPGSDRAHDEPSEGRTINPITGQFDDCAPPVNLSEMTDEEKEREAERLFVLFERLRKTGVMEVQNPITEAYQSGRMQEMLDSEERARRGHGKAADRDKTD
ncbi:uncharacterized protein VTP21DRAFT_2074 [Calcarisporiella thermophila]|uniref:uncharacterized protein n=1 Tax=Calcarisporiella thermophila TaxID=911321 RepID=UPI003741FECD